MTHTVYLTLNAGSSSLKFGVYDTGSAEPPQLLRGQVDNVGGEATLKLSGRPAQALGVADHATALTAIIDAAQHAHGNARVLGVGHRIAHGGLDHVQPAVLTDDVLVTLKALEPLAPLHQPHNLAGVAAAQQAFPDAVQMGCFDTAFHRDHPWVNDTFALPRRFYDAGVRRYGFHGLSYDYITSTLQAHHPDLAAGRVAIAHLGNGASLCAVLNNRSVASTMGFSALDGLPMGTRCGQLDPGALLYIMQQEQLDARSMNELLYNESGLKGLSGISHDMRTLEASREPEAQQAIDYYTFRIRRELGAMAAVLGGLDALVFCGGIGENSARIRRDVCEQMAWLGIKLDPILNAQNAECISVGNTPVMVIPTDEERVIARALYQYQRDSNEQR